MPYEIKDNTFTLFANDKKGNDKAPDFKGKGMVDGKEVQIAVWNKVSASGTNYMSGQISEPFKKEEKQSEESIEDITADEIPFNGDR